jgi:Helix-turn-helix domain
VIKRGGPVRESGVAERPGTAVNLHGLGDEYLTLAQLEAYSKISRRQLRNYLALPPGQALPCYRPGRKVLVRRSEFDTWLARYRQRGKPVLTRVLRGLGLDPERLPDTRSPRAFCGTAEKRSAR